MTRSLGTASSIPHQTPENEAPQRHHSMRGGEAAPNDWRYWFMRAHRAWAKRKAPWLLR